MGNYGGTYISKQSKKQTHNHLINYLLLSFSLLIGYNKKLLPRQFMPVVSSTMNVTSGENIDFEASLAQIIELIGRYWILRVNFSFSNLYQSFRIFRGFLRNLSCDFKTDQLSTSFYRRH